MGYRGPEAYFRWHLELCDLGSNVAAQLILLDILPVFQNYSQTDHLAVHVIIDSEVHSFRHGLMLSHNIVKLDGANLLATLVDELLYPSRDDDISIFILLALITCSEEAVGRERGLVGFRIVEITFRDVLPADAYLGL